MANPQDHAISARIATDAGRLLVDIRERASIQGEFIGGNGGVRLNIIDEELRPRGLATRSVEGAANKNELIGPVFCNGDVF